MDGWNYHNGYWLLFFLFFAVVQKHSVLRRRGGIVIPPGPEEGSFYSETIQALWSTYHDELCASSCYYRKNVDGEDHVVN